jgi:hypothetical protein
MPNIGTILREEISRLSRRESRSQVDATKKAAAQHRRDIAALKRQVAQLQRQVTQLSHKVLGAPPAVSSDPTAKRMRFAAKGLRSQRNRLGLSQTDMGTLWAAAPSRFTTGRANRLIHAMSSQGSWPRFVGSASGKLGKG